MHAEHLFTRPPSPVIHQPPSILHPLLPHPRSIVPPSIFNLQFSTASICSSKKLIQITNRNKSPAPHISPFWRSVPHIYGFKQGDRHN
jgi:hypothetical protein